MKEISKIDKLSIDQIKRLAGQSYLGVSATLFNSLILSIAVWNVTPRARIILWFLSAFTISLIRILFQLHFRKSSTTAENLKKRKAFLLSALFISGCVWGSAGVFLLPQSSIPHQVFITFVLGGMVAGSVGVFASQMAAFYLYSIPTVLPMIIYFFLLNDNMHFAMGTMMFVFWFIMLMTAKRLNREFIEFLNLKYENLDLVTNLEKEVKERKAAEESLLIKNQQIENIVLERTEELQRVNRRLVKEIEDHKKAVKALETSEQNYRELANSLPQVVFESDKHGNLNFTNRNANKFFGYDENDFSNGLNVFQMIISEDTERALKNLQQLLADKKSGRSEYTALRKNGSTFPIVVHVSPILKGEKAIGLWGIVIDLSEQKQLQEEQKKLETQLQRAQKMEALGTMAGGVAHDLNNILSGIVSYPDLLLMQIPEDSPLRKPVLTMQDSGKKAAAIVQDLLTLTRRGVVTEEVINLIDVISDYLESPEHEKLMSFHPKIRLDIDLADDLLNILGSPIHLTKTIMNLVSNGVEAIPEGGEIKISAWNQYLDLPVKGYDDIKKGDYVILSVSDNGVGISKDDIERIFEPFFTKKVMGRSGTGLGMAVVWGTVKDHNGYIDILSAEGQGTTFNLYFPVTRKEMSIENHTDGLEGCYGNGESILLVDDVKEQREIASALLEQIGYSVTSVPSGEEAVIHLKDNTIDLVVLDMIMDYGMDGLETYRKIIQLSPGQKAIIASGYSETDRVKEAQKLGAGAYIRKPYTLEKLGKAVRTELDKKNEAGQSH